MTLEVKITNNEAFPVFYDIYLLGFRPDDKRAFLCSRIDGDGVVMPFL